MRSSDGEEKTSGSGHHPDQETGVVTHAALALLWLYKRTLSPMLAFFGVRCRHMPSCSEYSTMAFKKHGAHRGAWLTLSRLFRCHPLGSHGWDPVPDNLPDAGWRVWRYGDWAWTERSGDCSCKKDTQTD